MECFCGQLWLVISSPQKNERSVDQLIKYMIDVAMGMHYLTERGLVHRVSCMWGINH